MTAFIHSQNKWFCKTCEARFKTYGYAVVSTASPVEIAIIDLDSWPLPEVTAEVTAYISASDDAIQELPDHALFRLKPVDEDALVDWAIGRFEGKELG